MTENPFWGMTNVQLRVLLECLRQNLPGYGSNTEEGRSCLEMLESIKDVLRSRETPHS